MEKEMCPVCNGMGIDPEDNNSECWYCDGEGEIEVEEELKYG